MWKNVSLYSTSHSHCINLSTGGIFLLLQGDRQGYLSDQCTPFWHETSLFLNGLSIREPAKTKGKMCHYILFKDVVDNIVNIVFLSKLCILFEKI